MRSRNFALVSVFALAALGTMGSRRADAQMALGGTFAGRPHRVVSMGAGRPYSGGYTDGHPYTSRYGSSHYRPGYGLPYRQHYRSAYYPRPYHPRYRARRIFVMFPFPHYLVRRVLIPFADPYRGY